MKLSLKQSIVSDPNFRKLDETEVLILGHVFEDAWLFNKIGNKQIIIGDFYGDPKCGLVSPNNDWVFVGGEHIVVWQKDIGLAKVESKEISWVVKVRLVSEYEIEFLVDPWSEYGAVWKLNILTLKRAKLYDFKGEDNY